MARFCNQGATPGPENTYVKSSKVARIHYRERCLCAIRFLCKQNLKMLCSASGKMHFVLKVGCVGMKNDLLQSDANSEDAEPKRGRAPSAKKHTRARGASHSAEKTEPCPKRQRQTKKAGGKTKDVEPASTIIAEVASPSPSVLMGILNGPALN